MGWWAHLLFRNGVQLEMRGRVWFNRTLEKPGKRQFQTKSIFSLVLDESILLLGLAVHLLFHQLITDYRTLVGKSSPIGKCQELIPKQFIHSIGLNLYIYTYFFFFYYYLLSFFIKIKKKKKLFYLSFQFSLFFFKFYSTWILFFFLKKLKRSSLKFWLVYYLQCLLWFF